MLPLRVAASVGSDAGVANPSQLIELISLVNITGLIDPSALSCHGAQHTRSDAGINATHLGPRPLVDSTRSSPASIIWAQLEWENKRRPARWHRNRRAGSLLAVAAVAERAESAGNKFFEQPVFEPIASGVRFRLGFYYFKPCYLSTRSYRSFNCWILAGASPLVSMRSNPAINVTTRMRGGVKRSTPPSLTPVAQTEVAKAHRKRRMLQAGSVWRSHRSRA